MLSKHSLVNLPKHDDTRGSLVFAQDGDHIPFAVQRFFLLYDLPTGAKRGGHAHHVQHQLIVMVSGGATITVDDGHKRTPVRLNNPTQALYVPPMLWLDLDSFTPGAACMVLASGLYSEADYICDRDAFLRATRR